MLIAAHTNVAVDRVLLGLKVGEDMCSPAAQQRLQQFLPLAGMYAALRVLAPCAGAGLQQLPASRLPQAD